MRWGLLVGTMVMVVGCGGEKPMPQLTVEFLQKTYGPDRPTLDVKVTGVSALGKVGAGTVSLTSTAGSLSESTLTLDAYGTARAVLTCDATVDPACGQRVSVSAEWQSDGVSVTGQTTNATYQATTGTMVDPGSTPTISMVNDPCTTTPPAIGFGICCANDPGFNFYPRCPAVGVGVGLSIPLSFTGSKGTHRTITLKWDSPASLSVKKPECQMQKPVLRSFDEAGALLDVMYHQVTAGIVAGGLWNAVVAGKGVTNNEAADVFCGTLAAVPSPRGLGVSFSAGTFDVGDESFSQDDGNDYFFTATIK